MSSGGSRTGPTLQGGDEPQVCLMDAPSCVRDQSHLFLPHQYPTAVDCWSVASFYHFSYFIGADPLWDLCFLVFHQRVLWNVTDEKFGLVGGKTKVKWSFMCATLNWARGPFHWVSCSFWQGTKSLIFRVTSRWSITQLFLGLDVCPKRWPTCCLCGQMLCTDPSIGPSGVLLYWGTRNILTRLVLFITIHF